MTFEAKTLMNTTISDGPKDLFSVFDNGARKGSEEDNLNKTSQRRFEWYQNVKYTSAVVRANRSMHS